MILVIQVRIFDDFKDFEDYYDLNDYNPYYVEIYNGILDMDWTHSNSVFFDENSGSVFVSIRNLSRITKIDYASKDIIWNMGQTDFMNEIYFEEDLNFSQQHSVQVLDNGNLLFFDNHRYLSPELSRCLEISYDELHAFSHNGDKINHVKHKLEEYFGLDLGCVHENPELPKKKATSTSYRDKIENYEEFMNFVISNNIKTTPEALDNQHEFKNL